MRDQQLLDAGMTAMPVGDAAAVRNLRAAVTDGARAGLTLDEGLTLNANRQTISLLPSQVAWLGDERTGPTDQLRGPACESDVDGATAE